MRLFFCFISVVVTGTAASSSSANHFPLHRTFPHVPTPHFHSLRARDRLRHSRVLRRLPGGVVNFSVEGSSDPFVGLYFTKVKLGNPQREYNVQIDTGSDILWVTCSPCDGCPQSSGLGIELNLFDTTKSSSARIVPCSDPICVAVSTTTNKCLSQTDDHCSYTFHYRDRSGTSGYYVADSMHFDMILGLGESMIANSSATIVFGCSIYQYGDLTRTTKALDGIFGFGQGEFSVISQLSSGGITPKVFSHCLKGGDNGGGILVLGEIMEPSIVYSPLIPSRSHYTLNLQSIAISGQLFTELPISNAGETIIDSGTTLAYLVEEIYVWIVNVITSAVSQSATPTISRGNQCYRVSTSIAEIFPVVSFNFEGIASMVLKPEEYLQFDSLEPALWCIGFQKAEDGVNILGDLVLKDKIIVYDLAQQRIGWVNFDCKLDQVLNTQSISFQIISESRELLFDMTGSLPVNVSVTSGKDVFINEGQPSVSSSSRKHFYQLLHVVTVLLLIHLKLF